MHNKHLKNKTGNVKHKGDRFKVMGFLDVKDGGNPPVLLSALKEILPVPL